MTTETKKRIDEQLRILDEVEKLHKENLELIRSDMEIIQNKIRRDHKYIQGPYPDYNRKYALRSDMETLEKLIGYAHDIKGYFPACAQNAIRFHKSFAALYDLPPYEYKSEVK